jgi:NADH-quinone oxidoreductase subunit N
MSDLHLQLIGIAPELFIVLSSLVLLVAGVIRGNSSAVAVNALSVFVLVGALYFTAMGLPIKQVMFEGMLLKNDFTQFVKGMILVSAIMCLILTHDWLSDEENQRFEFPILVLLSVAGMLLLVSAHDLIAIYMAIELMSLALYVLAAFNRDSLRSTEAGLKYFVLGSLASGLMLFGMSLVYGFMGTTNFLQLKFEFAHMFAEGNGAIYSAGAIIGVVLMIVGFAFKVSAVPFHMWTPDVYDGAPTPVTMLFAVAPKIAGLVIFLRVLLEPFGSIFAQWQPILIMISAASMLVGAFGALWQTSIKRLLAYSSIGHVGYVLIGLAVNSQAGIQAMLIYLCLYLVTSIGMFGCILMTKRNGQSVERIEDLAGLAQSNPKMAFLIATFIFSMAGIPPLAGFFGKFYIFLAALQSGLYVLAVIGVLSSVIACFYYLKIVKTMYFDKPAGSFDTRVVSSSVCVVYSCAVFALLFFVHPSTLVEPARKVVETMFMQLG